MFEVKGITIHNTGNSKSALENYKMLVNDKTLYLCHLLIDEKDCIICSPLEAEAYHTGVGYDFGNMNTLAVEICRSTSSLELYKEAESNAVRIIKELMQQYNLTTNDLYFHSDFNTRARCPHRILDIYKNKSNFIKGVFNDIESNG